MENNFNTTTQEFDTQIGCIPPDNLCEMIPNFINNHWDYENNKIKPQEVSLFSKRKYFWINNSGISFYLSPLERYKKRASISFPEASIYYFLKKYFPNTISRFKHDYENEKIETDIYLPDIKLAIEYDGEYWHATRTNNDNIKNLKLNELGIFVIHVRESKLQELNPFNGVTINIQENNDENIVIVLNQILDIIAQHIKINYKHNNLLRYDKTIQIREYKNNIKKINEMLYLDMDYLSKEESYNFYCKFGNDILNNSELKQKFSIITNSRTAYWGIQDVEFIKKWLAIDGVNIFIDFSVFDNNHTNIEWLYNYLHKIIYSESFYYLESVIMMNINQSLPKYKSTEDGWLHNNLSKNMWEKILLLMNELIEIRGDYYRAAIWNEFIVEIRNYVKKF